MTKQDQAKQYMEGHLWEDAIPILVCDISENPDDPWSPMFLGSCYYELRDYSEALKWFQHAERLLPDDPTPIGLQADAMHARGDSKEAGALYKKALSIAPDSQLAIKNWNRYVAIESNAEPQSGAERSSADAPDRRSL